jgi:hypothetical protein
MFGLNSLMKSIENKNGFILKQFLKKMFLLRFPQNETCCTTAKKELNVFHSNNIKLAPTCVGIKSKDFQR